MTLNNKALKRLAGSGFDIWDWYSEKTKTTMITFEDNRIDKISSGVDSGIGIRGIKDLKTFYGYTNEPANAEKVVDTISSTASEKDVDYTILDPESIHKIEIFPDTIETSKKIELLKEANDAARTGNGKITQVTATYAEKIQDIEIINDLGNHIKERRVYTSFIIIVIAADGSRIETAHRVISGHAGYEAVDRKIVLEEVRKTSELAQRLLTVDKKIAGEMTVVMSAEAGGTMIHEAVGHSLEADLVQKDMSEYKGRKGEKVASKLVTVVDDATLPNKRGSFMFDDEGIAAQKTVLIEAGILKNFMYDRETAAKDGVESTGNGRRESYKHKPIPRMRNTMIAPGKGRADDLIKDTKNGMFVKSMGGGQVNTVTGDFIFEVKEGFMIENGKITEPVRDATIMGKGVDVLNTIDGVCDDIGFEVGTCGKDGQGVPVADAQPTLRVPKILVGSK